MKWSLLIGAGSVLGAHACGDSISAIAEASSDLVVNVPEEVYRWDGVSPGDGMVITASLSNQGQRAYVARLGDGFNSAEEHSVLYVAAGSDAYLERAEGSNWAQMDRAILIEGVRDVTLVPGSSYTLHTYLLNDQITGVFRIRVEYATDDGDTTRFEAFSEEFEIR